MLVEDLRWLLRDLDDDIRVSTDDFGNLIVERVEVDDDGKQIPIYEGYINLLTEKIEFV
jgi:hypothetical protein